MKIKLSVEKNILLLHHIFNSSPNKLSGTGFVFVLAINKKSSAFLKFDSAKSALLGKIYSLKPLCYIVYNRFVHLVWYKT